MHLFRGETHIKNGHRLGKPFEIERAPRIEIKALPNAEFTHRCRNSYATGRGHSAKSFRQLNSCPEQVASFCNWLPDADPNTEADGPLRFSVPVAQGALNVYGRLNCSRHGRKRRHDSIAGVLDLASSLFVQCGPHYRVVLANERHELVVAHFLGLLCRVTNVGEEDYSNSRVDVCLACRVSWNLTKKRINGPVAHLDDVVSNQAVRLPVYSFQRLSVRSLGETKDGPLCVVEPIRDVANLIFRLNRKIEFVCGGDGGSRRARRIMSIKEQGHARYASDKGDFVSTGSLLSFAELIDSHSSQQRSALD